MLNELLESIKTKNLSGALIVEFEKLIDIEAARWPKASIELLEDCRGEALMNLVRLSLKIKPMYLNTEEDALRMITDIIRESHTNVIAKWKR